MSLTQTCFSILIKYKFLIFDLDGTLLDSAEGIEYAFYLTYEKIYKIQCPVNIKKHIGPPIKEVLQLVNQECDAKIIDTFIEEFKNNYDTIGFKMGSLYRDVDTTLNVLNKLGCRLFLATNKRQHPTHLILNHFCIESQFCKVYSPDKLNQAFTNKSEMVNFLLIENFIKKENCLLIGDTMHDFIAANENGIDFAFVPYGYGNCYGAKYNLKSIKQIINIL